MIKKASIIALAFSILVSGAAFAGNNETGTGNTTEESNIEWQYTFEDEKTFFEDLDLSQTDMASLEKLFNEAIALEKANQFEAAEQKWDNYFNLLDEKLPKTNFEEYTFEDEKEFLEELGFNKEEMATIEKLFNEAIALDKEEKYEEAEKKWDAFYAIIDVKLPEMDFMEYTFEDEKEFLEELGLNKEEMATIEKLFNEATALDKEEKYEEAEKKWDAFYAIIDEKLPEDFDESYTFEDEKEFLEELGLNKEEMATIEKLFNEALALEKAEKYEEAEKKWDALYNIIDEKLPEFDFEDYTFEVEKDFLEKLNLDSKVMTELENLFNKAIALEEVGKDAEAEKVWEAYDSLLESNLPEEYKIKCD
ncbi:MAG: hypothetical protein JEZ08_13890 [Clostridiales bacterium]|nr:hypothetical protein [Clostridiales bacterium]